MKFDDNADLDTSQVDDIRGQGGGVGGGDGGGGGGMFGGGAGGGRFPIPGRMAAGGGGAMLLILGLVLRACLGGGGGSAFNLPGAGSQSVQVQPQNPNAVQLGRGAASGVTQNCKTGADANRRQDCRIVGIANSVQAYWADDLPRRGKEYVKAKTVLFSGSVTTGCGGATAAAGPFYCPADQRVYLDLDFFKVFESQFGGTDTPFTEAYVIAHEYGHHVQNLLGISAKVEKSGDRQGATSSSVRLELQADCFAGVWAKNATSGPSPLIVNLTDKDITEGLDAAAKVGDDYIQKNLGGGRVNPDAWTHGSSEERQRWFRNGYKTGELTDCDTFNTDTL